MIRSILLLALLAAGDSPAQGEDSPGPLPTERVTVGAKAFTESVILRDLAVGLGEHVGADVDAKELPGTGVWKALVGGAIDIYPEYTGTLRLEIFSDRSLPDEASLRAALAEYGVEMGGTLGFDNSYELCMKRDVAERFEIESISDLKRYPDLQFGFSNEFLDRNDGWPGLRSRYELPQTKVVGMEHGVAYQALESGDIHVTDAYGTDPKVRLHDLKILDDDRDYFPYYEAMFLYRRELAERAPRFLAEVRRLDGRIDAETMRSLSERVEVNHETTSRVAADFLKKEFGISVTIHEPGLLQRIWTTTLQHLFLVLVSLGAAIAVAIPLGIISAKRPVAGHLILTVTEVIQTVPGLALLVFIGAAFVMLGLPMIGAPPAITALFLYALLPILRNTIAGLNSVPRGLHESAVALGLPPLARLIRIELPMASRMILAGIKTTAVITIGYAALGGLIAAGGYGQPIMTGLRLYDVPKMMEGAVPAAVMALTAKTLFEWSERWLVPAGLRL